MKALLALVFFFSAQAQAQSLGLIDVKGTINPGSAAYIEEAVKIASAQKLQGLIIRLDTPGGLLSSTRDIVQSFSTSQIPIIIYVTPGGASATSAGAILSIAAHVIAMAPGTNIGAAHPVQDGGGDIKGVMGEKVTNDTAALVRSQALLRGRNQSLAEEFVRKSSSFTAEEATKEKLADLIAKDTNELLAKLDGRSIVIDKDHAPVQLHTKDLNEDALVKIPMRLGYQFLHILANPNISTMLLALGGVAIYAEVSSGFSVLAPGVIGIVALLLAFVSLQLLPINLGGVLLFLAGAAMLIAEAFFVSYGILAFAGLGAIIIGALFLIDPTSGSAIRVSWMILGPIVSGFAVIIAFIAFQLSSARKTHKKNFDRLLGETGKVQFVDATGKAGKVFVQGELWNFVSDHALQSGAQVTVSSQHGLQLKIHASHHS